MTGYRLDGSLVGYLSDVICRSCVICNGGLVGWVNCIYAELSYTPPFNTTHGDKTNRTVNKEVVGGTFTITLLTVDETIDVDKYINQEKGVCCLITYYLFAQNPAGERCFLYTSIKNNP